jgi:alpha-L-rhamnosidase
MRTVLNIQDIKIEHLREPIGIDILEPVFSYTLRGDSRSQSAYRLVCAYDDAFSAVAYDTGKVISSAMNGIRYQGTPLKSRDRVFIRFKAWDEDGREGDWSSAACFEMGLLDRSDWTAKWITGDYFPDKKERYPVDCFRRTFEVRAPVERARLYITACGLYEATINGEKAGNAALAPGYTEYSKRIQYQTWDITGLIKLGENKFEGMLADGWYRGCVGCRNKRNVFGTETKLLAQLELFYADGTLETINTDGGWQWSNDGALRFADLKQGEVCDAGLLPSYSGKARVTTCNVVPTASNNVVINEHEIFTPRLITTPTGVRILDFGQNIAGYISFRVKEKQGQKITVRLGEALNKGEFTQENFQYSKKDPIEQKVVFICSGREDNYHGKFYFSGFRYALVEGLSDIRPENFRAIAIYSDLEQTGDFECSNELINQFVSNTRWSMKGNFLDIPADCPTREKAGWTGDAQIFCKTASFFMNVMPFFQKWLLDIADRQAENGRSNSIVPSVGDYFGTYMDGSVGWGDACIIIPYTLWKMFDSPEIIERCYSSMRAYACWELAQCKKTHIMNLFKRNPYKKFTYDTGMHLGEWLEPKDVDDTNSFVASNKPKTEEATAYLHHTMTLMVEAAHALGKEKDERLFQEYMEGTKNAYNFLFVKEDAIDTSRQAKLVRPVALGLVDGEAKKNINQRLDRAIREGGYRIGTGFLSTPYILPVLTDAGMLDTAFSVLENEECPGWLYEPKRGATTIWEQWAGYDETGAPQASHNHYAFGSVCGWLFDTVAGIHVDRGNHFTLAPHYGGTLTHAKAHYDSIYGKVVSEWRLKNGRFFLEVTIPCNTTADIVLPNGENHSVNCGKHKFAIQP